MEKLMTIEELAETLNYSPPTVRRWVLNNEIPFYKVQGEIWFKPSEIEHWINNRKKSCPDSRNIDREGDLFGETETGQREPSETCLPQETDSGEEQA